MIFGPNPPPTNGATTRTCDSSRPRRAARPLRIGIGACVVSQMVSSSACGFHSASDAAVLERGRGATVVEKAAADNRAGLRPGRRVVALALHDVRGGVGCQVLVHERRAWRQRFLEIDDRIQRLDVDDHVAHRVFGDVATLGDDHRDRLADVAHLVLGERPVRAGMEHQPGDRRRRHEQRRRRSIVAEVGERVDSGHAAPLPCGRGVDLDQARVRVFAAHERHVQHARELHVVDEARAPGQQARVLVAGNPRVNVAGFG